MYQVVVGGEAFGEDANVYAIILWHVASWIGMVVLMNFIIADMGSTYERVKERSSVTKVKERVALLLEAERCISFAAPRRFWHRVFGEYLFICTKATQHDDGTQDSWDSFTGSIKKGLAKFQQKMEAMFASLTSQLKATTRVGSEEEREEEEEEEGMSEKLRKIDERQQKAEDALRQLQDGQRLLQDGQQKTEDVLRQLQDGQQKMAAMIEALAVLQGKEQGVGVERPTLAAPMPEPPRS